VRALLTGIPQDGIALGDPNAPVTLVEFADLQCPFCRDFALQTLPLIVRDYVHHGKLRIELRTLAFIGPDSVRAGRLAEGAAAQDRLWHFAHLFYFNQGAENSGYATDEFLDGLLAAIPGLDAERARRDGGERLVADAEEIAGRHGIRSTPSLLIGRTGAEPHTRVEDPLDYAAVKAAIERELER
jgi:protein-disulfide isomerase